ncbi:MAG: hypothetical protein M1371_07105 [Actinobacteria bacterium]|nr:hypothetical protein [Actinomycetota bacterium]
MPQKASIEAIDKSGIPHIKTIVSPAANMRVIARASAMFKKLLICKKYGERNEKIINAIIKAIDNPCFAKNSPKRPQIIFLPSIDLTFTTIKCS